MEPLDIQERNDTPQQSRPLSSNPPHSDPPLRQNGLFNSWNKSGSGRKRSYSNLNDAPDDPAFQLQAEFEAAAEEDDGHTPKKSRGPDWPLSVNTENQGSTRSAKNARTPKKGSARSRLRLGKSSKFIEGSMRDRESDMPPDQYLKQESAMEDYADGQTGDEYTTDGSRMRASVDTNLSYDAGIDRNRPSSMYRFGKALANAFNPSYWFKERSSESPIKSPTDDVMGQRKAMAERQYAELKKAGFQGTRKIDSARSSTDQSHRDSGVDMSSLHSHEAKKDGRIFDEFGVPLLRPPPIPSDGMPSPGLVSESGSSIFDSAKQVHRRRPSMPSLKKVKSHFSIPNLRQHDPLSPLPSIEHDDNAQRIKKKQSKKDLQKQQKLSKRISNLETQLEKARRELNKTIGVEEPIVMEDGVADDLNDIDENLVVYADEEHDGPNQADLTENEAQELEDDIEMEEAQEPIAELPPFRQPSSSPNKRFVPSLPSLPSERLLFPQTKQGAKQSDGSSVRTLPPIPKTVNPDPVALAIERKLGLHLEDEATKASIGASGSAPQKQTANDKTKKTAPKKLTARSLKKVASKASLTGAGIKKGNVTLNNPKTRSKETKKQIATQKAANEEAVTEPHTSELEQTPKKTQRRRRSSAKKDDKTFKPGKDDNDDDEWQEASKANQKVKRTRQASSRKSSGTFDAAEKKIEAGKSEPTKKENTKPSPLLFKNPAEIVSIDKVLTQNNVSSEGVGLSVKTPASKSSSSKVDTSPNSAIDDPTLFANATAFAPDVVKTAGVSHLGLDDSTPPIPLSPDTAKRAHRSMSPPPTATFSKLPKADSSTDALPSITESHVDDALPAVRGSSPTAVPLPKGSPIRGKRQSLKPPPKRAGDDEPITVTPGRGSARGVPPVPKVPDGVQGKRSVVTRHPRSEESWHGWDDDVF